MVSAPAWLCRRIGTAEVPLGDSAFPRFCIAFTIVSFWKSIDFVLGLKGFRRFPDCIPGCGLCLLVFQLPLQLSVCSSQLPGSRFHLPGSQFQFRSKLDLSTSVARERVPAPGASTASAKACEPQPRHVRRHVFAQKSSENQRFKGISYSRRE